METIWASAYIRHTMDYDDADPTVLALGSFALGGPASPRSSVEYPRDPVNAAGCRIDVATTDRQSERGSLREPVEERRLPLGERG